MNSQNSEQQTVTFKYPSLTNLADSIQQTVIQAFKHPGVWIALVVVLILGLRPIYLDDAFMREEMFTIMMFIALVSSLNILMGYTGYVSFGHIVFFGLGGYIGLYVISEKGWTLEQAILAGGFASGLLAFLVGRAILHLRGGYFALATIGINEAVKAFINNFEPFGGPTGLSLNFSVYKDYGGAMDAVWYTYKILIALAVASIILSALVKNSKFGLGLLAIREDEDAAEVMGVVPSWTKTWAYVLSAIIPGMIGVLFFFKNGVIQPPQAFRLHMSIELLVMVMLGGYGTILGPVFGAWGYQELRGYLLTSDQFKDFQLAIAGGLLLMIILFIPAGAVGALRQRFPVLRRFLT